jgi:hypothetical protein
MAAQALFGFAGVILGAVITSILSLYREGLVGKRELAILAQQHERERKSAHDTFQRESILALQTAVTDLVKAAYEETDRLLAEFKRTGQWNTRQWETPTATGWSAAILTLESSRARVFDEELRNLAGELRTAAGNCVWADDLDSAKEASRPIEQLLRRFHAGVTKILPTLY